ncbi:MAG: glycosyltransferase family 2 protein [Sedimentitalea sp.]
MSQQTKPGLAARLSAKAARIAKRARLLRSIKHVHGPRRFQSEPDDVIVMALVRDGAFYLRPFLAHYRSLGVRHFVFFDNGSSDDTIAQIRTEPGTVIVQSTLPWGDFENDFRRYAAETFCAGRWCLFADMDELFDFPASASIGLSGLVRYLNANGFSALMAQMLEMFPKAPLAETAQMPYDTAIATYDYYDISQLDIVPYHAQTIEFEFFLRENTLGDPRISFLFGGVRGKVFGERCCLSKHPLVFVGEDVAPGVHPHCSQNVACADFTAVIKHYKFTNQPLARDAALVADQAIGHGEDKLRLSVLERDPDLTLFSNDARRFDGLDALYDSGFLIRSPRFEAFVAGAKS